MKDRRSEGAIKEITAHARKSKMAGRKRLEYQPNIPPDGGYQPPLTIETNVLKNGNISFHIHNEDKSCTFTLNSIVQKRYKARKKK